VIEEYEAWLVLFEVDVAFLPGHRNREHIAKKKRCCELRSRFSEGRKDPRLIMLSCGSNPGVFLLKMSGEG